MYTDNYSEVITKLTNDEYRNTLICKEIASDLKKFDEAILIISDRKKHVNLIQEMLSDDFGIPSICLTGGINKAKRTEYVDKIRKKECKVVLATTSLIGEGFDAPYLTALFLTTPIKFSGRLIQACGRVLRPEKSKVPRIYDFRDNKIQILKYSGFGRDRVYKKEWAT
jgi:superfamily II DNA or RNA helicase